MPSPVEIYATASENANKKVARLRKDAAQMRALLELLAAPRIQATVNASLSDEKPTCIQFGSDFIRREQWLTFDEIGRQLNDLERAEHERDQAYRALSDAEKSIVERPTPIIMLSGKG